MKYSKNIKGISLIGVVVYLAILMMVLPALVLFLLRGVEYSHTIDMRVRIEQTGSVFLQKMNELLFTSTSIDSTHSSLGADNSILIFTDKDGEEVTIQCVDEERIFSGVTHTVSRLQVQKTGQDAYWFTDQDMQVEQWRVDAVRNSSGDLTGLRFTVRINELDPKEGDPSIFEATTTIALEAQTEEL